jgi:ribose transport system permease protein
MALDTHMPRIDEASTKARATDGGTVKRPRRSIPGLVGQLGIPLFLILVFAVFAVLRPDSYPTWDNVRAILDNQAIVVILCLAVMTPLIVGEFDLSAANITALTAVSVIGLQVNQGLAAGAAVILSVLLGAGIGLANGIIVVKLRVPAFVATLGMATLLSGLWLLYLNNQIIISPLPTSFTAISRNDALGIPLPVIYAAIVAIGMWVALNLLPVGRRMYAVGGNRRAAHLTGIRTDRIVIGAFLVSGLLSGIGGVLLGAQLGSATGGTGSSLLLPAFAGAFLGATTIRPGRFNVIGSIVSVYALAFLISGLEQLGANVWVGPVFDGATVIIAVALSSWAFRLKAARARRDRLRELERAEANATTELVG